MKNLICNHCGKEVSATNLTNFSPLYHNYATAEQLIAEKPRTVREIADILDVSIVSSTKICNAVAEKTFLAQQGQNTLFIYKPKQ